MDNTPLSEIDPDSVWGANAHKHIKSTMLFGKMRQYIIHKVKAPLAKAIILIAGRLPEPTKQNCDCPNTHILLDIRDKFFNDMENNPGRKDLFQAAFRIFICEYEHDPYYRYRFDWVVEEMIKRGWQPRPPGRPRGICWREFHDYTKD
jgi:hypothetical protein